MGKVVGIGMDYSPTSKVAVKWTIDNLVNNGDEIIIIHVVSGKGGTQRQLWQDKGSPLIPLDEFKEINLPVLYGISPDKEILDLLDTASKTKGIKVVAKVYWGDAREKICEAVEDLKLNTLVVGSRGLGALKRVLLGSVSSHVVQNATCPVTVVKSKA